MDSYVKDFTDALTRYDERLALVQTNVGHWEIWRVAEDGTEYRVIRSKVPGAGLGPGVIEMLAQRDMQRQGAQQVEKLIQHNERVEKEAQDKYHEAAYLALDKMLSKSWRGHVPSNVEDLDL